MLANDLVDRVVLFLTVTATVLFNATTSANAKFGFGFGFVTNVAYFVAVGTLGMQDTFSAQS